MASPPAGLTNRQTQNWANSFQANLRRQGQDPSQFGFGRAQPIQPQSQGTPYGNPDGSWFGGGSQLTKNGNGGWTMAPGGNFGNGAQSTPAQTGGPYPATSVGKKQPFSAWNTTANPFGQQAGGTFTPGGGDGNMAYAPPGQRPQPFTQNTSFGGQQFGNMGDAFAMRDAFVQSVNQAKAPFAQQWGAGNPTSPALDFDSLMRQAGDMVQGGWTNPLSPGRSLPTQSSGAGAYTPGSVSLQPAGRAQPIQPPSQGLPYGYAPDQHVDWRLPDADGRGGFRPGDPRTGDPSLPPPTTGGPYPTPKDLGYGTAPGRRGLPRTGDFRDGDGDGVDDRDQDGPGMPRYASRSGTSMRWRPQPAMDQSFDYRSKFSAPAGGGGVQFADNVDADPATRQRLSDRVETLARNGGNMSQQWWSDQHRQDSQYRQSQQQPTGQNISDYGRIVGRPITDDRGWAGTPSDPYAQEMRLRREENAKVMGQSPPLPQSGGNSAGAKALSPGTYTPTWYYNDQGSPFMAAPGSVTDPSKDGIRRLAESQGYFLRDNFGLRSPTLPRT